MRYNSQAHTGAIDTCIVRHPTCRYVRGSIQREKTVAKIPRAHDDPACVRPLGRVQLSRLTGVCMTIACYLLSYSTTIDSSCWWRQVLPPARLSRAARLRRFSREIVA